MAWWAWLLLAWAAVAVLGAVWLGLALRNSETRDRALRGAPDRRHRSRDGDFEDWVRQGSPERRTASPAQERAVVAARAAAGYATPDRRRSHPA